jgi:hypothetical protein
MFPGPRKTVKFMENFKIKKAEPGLALPFFTAS